MKKIKRAAWLLMAACMAAGSTLHGQTFNNFIHGSITNSASRSVIRGHGATEAVVYYESGGGHFLALVDPTGLVRGARLNPGYAVYDIRLAGDMAYFCGKNAGHGFIGVVKLNDLRSPSPNVHYFDLDADKVGELTRMVAYQMGGVTKVAAVGQHNYTYTDSSEPYAPYVAPYTSRKMSLLVECDFSGYAMVRIGLLIINAFHNEMAFDIVETDRYVAVVTQYGETAVHRCDKADVLGTFPGNAYLYPAPYIEGLTGYSACKTTGDAMAVVCMATATGSRPYEIHMRHIDLQSMLVTSYQGYDILEKSGHSDLVYMPRHAALVMLQNHPFPPTACHYPFVYWDILKTSSYNARVMVESPLPHDMPYYSLDRLGGSHYVATGGDYWFMKDVASDNPASTCYQIYKLKIKILEPQRPGRLTASYDSIPLDSIPSYSTAGVSDTATLNCFTS